jgi:hypothetical protein
MYTSPLVRFRLATLFCGFALTAVLSVAAADRYFDETKVTTFFAFDDVSIPYTQNLRVKMRPPEKHPGNPVVARGPAGSVDAWAVQFYGSVIRDGDKYRLWYAAASDRPPSGPNVPRWRPAYAESKDGIHWTKPNLGLVDHHGSKANNLVPIDPPELSFLNLKVLHEPEDPDPSRRYKMTTHVFYTKGRRLGTLVPFFSPDGIHWKTARPVKPVGTEIGKEDLFLPWTHFEPAGGLYKWDGLYYASGQNAVVADRPYHGRIARAFVSGDFVNWAHANAVNFTRTAQHKLLGGGRGRDGEQTHEGVSVWNRGNVLLGIHGIWHGDMSWTNVTIDLGFLVSNDGIRFREPAHEWAFIERGPDGAWDEGGLLQGQGFENIGDRTLVYYGSWDPRPHAHEDRALPVRGGVGVVTLPRDRFGDLVLEPSGLGAGSYHIPADEAVCEFMTKSFDVPAGAAPRFHFNVDGLGPQAAIRVELLGHDLKPLPGFYGKDAAVLRQNGFQVPVDWAGRTAIGGLPERVRLRAVYEGARRQDIRFSALYIQTRD